MTVAIRNCFIWALMSIALLTTSATAQTALGTPTGPTILTVSGDLSVTNQNDAAVFDAEMLRALNATTIETSTIWTDGVQTFAGVALVDLLQVLGVTEGTLRATAINDYTVEIPVSDAVENGPILAYDLNGKAMSVREKGPLWVVYPYDASADYRTEVVYARSIWQLDRIEIVK